MQSELHERLEYLVNYSSQLIFVSGESIAEQQKTLEAFVFQQHDDTEIAYLTAQENMDTSDYRRQLCRQLLGQVVGSFVRPLNELLVDLNGHEGPILIAITQAHHLPDKLLQELWDLVLQSRFAGNKQHMNVLLFANSQWAENAKQWLPAKNTETPLIISSQSVMSEQPTFESDLDKMIASRREAFQAHLENRQRENTLTFSNPLKSKWLYGVIAVIFLVTFSGLVYWQYGSNLSGLFAPIESGNTITTAPQAVPGSAYDSLLEENTDNQDTTRNDTKITGDSTAPDDIATIDVVTVSESEQEAPLLNDDANLVTDWNTAVSSLGPSNKTQSAITDDSQRPNQDSDVIEPTTLVDEKPIAVASANNENEKENEANTENVWIGPSQYAIQMLAMKDERVLEQFLLEYGLYDKTRVYKTQRYGGDWFVVVDKTLYPNFNDAQQARSTLPDFPGKQNAFVKNGEQVLKELALTDNP